MSAHIMIEETDNTIGRNRSLPLHIDLIYPEKPPHTSDLDWNNFLKLHRPFTIFREVETFVTKRWMGDPEYVVKEKESELPEPTETSDSLQIKWCSLHQTPDEKESLQKEDAAIDTHYRLLLGVTFSGAALSIPGICMFAVGIVMPALNAQALSLSFGVPGAVMFLVGIALIAGSEFFSKKISKGAKNKQGILKCVAQRAGLWSDKIRVSSEGSRSRPNSRGHEEGKGGENTPPLN